MGASSPGFSAASATAFKAISRYPKVVRDLAVVVDDMVTCQQIEDAVATLSDDRIQSVELFDIYRGPGVPDGRQSLALSVSFQDPQGTLDDQAIQELVDQVVRVLRNNADAELRG